MSELQRRTFSVSEAEFLKILWGISDRLGVFETRKDLNISWFLNVVVSLGMPLEPMIILDALSWSPLSKTIDYIE